jgi:PAS domain S-box-containing protein
LKEIIGFADDEFANSISAWQARILPEDLPELERSVQEHLAGRTDLYEVQYRIRHKDGSLRWIYSRGRILRDPRGRPLRWTGIDSDITARKQAETALLDSERLYSTLAQSMADGAALIQDGKIVFANESLARMCGHQDRQSMTGAPAESFLLQIYRAHELEMALSQDSNQDWVPGKSLEALSEAHDGRKFWASAHSTVIKWREQPGVLAVIRDVTEIVAKREAFRQEADQLKGEFERLRSSIRERYRLGQLIGKSEPMQRVYDLILKAAGTDASVVVFGESGAGKELVARAIHDLSPRSGKVFVPVNCGAIPESLIESEFFGHKKGAFTGAYIEKHGYLHTADGGTLFLDEIGEIGLNLQVKLLRAIENGEYTPLGDTRVKRSNARFVAATSKNLAAMVKQGLMREDFYYRIAVILITVAPLRERKEDIPLLVEHFLKRFSQEPKFEPLPGKIMDALLNYDWPGNVRELQNVLQRYLTTRALDFLEGLAVREESPAHELAATEDYGQDLNEALLKFEKALILKALEQHQWNKTRAAEALGIDRRSLFRKMEKTGII